MLRFCALLAAGALALGSAAVRAEEDTATLLQVDQPAAAADRSATAAPAAAQPAAPQPAPPMATPGAPCNCNCCCSNCGEGHVGCHRFREWLTFCPVKSPCCGHSCHSGCGSCGGGCGGDSSCCCACSPCCHHLYVYFLDRCQPNFGYSLPTPGVVGPIPSKVPLEGPPGGDCNPCGPGPYCHYPCGAAVAPPAPHQ
jgi:hypothetical protein